VINNFDFPKTSETFTQSAFFIFSSREADCFITFLNLKFLCCHVPRLTKCHRDVYVALDMWAHKIGPSKKR
jgi:hypothetical protein